MPLPGATSSVILAFGGDVVLYTLVLGKVVLHLYWGNKCCICSGEESCYICTGECRLSFILGNVVLHLYWGKS